MYFNSYNGCFSPNNRGEIKCSGINVQHFMCLAYTCNSDKATRIITNPDNLYTSRREELSDIHHNAKDAIIHKNLVSDTNWRILQNFVPNLRTAVVILQDNCKINGFSIFSFFVASGVSNKPLKFGVESSILLFVFLIGVLRTFFHFLPEDSGKGSSKFGVMGLKTVFEFSSTATSVKRTFVRTGVWFVENSLPSIISPIDDAVSDDVNLERLRLLNFSCFTFSTENWGVTINEGVVFSYDIDLLSKGVDLKSCELDELLFAKSFGLILMLFSDNGNDIE
uniref:Uncharacterized protein n=1 Tax=Romanomermis culicivorax TaxID=13658 RepID=A0A915ITV8_ROMCU